MVVAGEYEECNFTVIREEENVTAIIYFDDHTNYTYHITSKMNKLKIKNKKLKLYKTFI